MVQKFKPWWDTNVAVSLAYNFAMAASYRTSVSIEYTYAHRPSSTYFYVDLSGVFESGCLVCEQTGCLDPRLHVGQFDLYRLEFRYI
jgi:hypothetical protein